MDIERKVSGKLRNCLNSIKDATAEIWRKPILTHYTNHDLEHSKNIVDLLNKILETAPDDLLNEHESFVLLASAYLHDIGMQCTLALDDPNKTSFSLEDKERIRNYHHKCSKQLIYDNINNSRIPLGLEQCKDYVPFIVDVVESHSSKVKIDEIEDTSFKHEDMKLKLLSALLKLADELDRDFSRVNINELQLWNIPPDSKFHWWTHHYTQSIQIKNGTIKLFFRFPKQYCDDEIKDIFIKKTISSIKDQLDEVYSLLWDNNVKLNLDDDIKIDCSNVVLETIPDDLLEYINQSKSKTDKISLKTDMSAKSGFVTRNYWYSDDNLYANNKEILIHLKRGYELVNNGKFLEAIEEAENGLLLTTTPKEKIGFLLFEGNCYSMIGKIDIGKEYHEKALKITKMERVKEIYQKDAVMWQYYALIGIAMDYTHMGVFDEAIKFYDEALKINSSSDIVYLNKGAALAGLVEYDKAIKCFSRSIDINPNDIAFENKGRALGIIGEYEKALKCFEEAIKLNPKNDMAISNTGNVFLFQKNYTEAIVWYDKALDINPNNEHAYNNKGNALSLLKKFKEAIKCYDEAIRINASFLEVYINKAGTLNQLGKLEEAISCIDIAISLDKRNNELYFIKAMILLRSKDINPAKYLNIMKPIKMDHTEVERHEKALKCLNKSLELKPDFEIALVYKEEILMMFRKFKEAIDCSDIILGINPNKDDILLSKGVALAELERYDEAIICYNKAIKINSRNDMAYNNKGYSLMKLGKYNEALKNLYRAIMINPNNRYAKENIILSQRELNKIK